MFRGVIFTQSTPTAVQNLDQLLSSRTCWAIVWIIEIFFYRLKKKNLYLSWPLATIEKRVVSFYTGLKIAKVVIEDLGGFNRDRILKAMIIRLISTSLSIKKTWHWLYYRFYAELKRTWIGNPFSEFSNDFRKKVFIKYQFKNKKTVIGERL